MKITFKQVGDLISYFSNNNTSSSLDPSFLAFLEKIAGETFETRDIQVQTDGKKIFRIDIGESVRDGVGSNREQTTFFPEDVLSNIDYEGYTYWTCRRCNCIVNSTIQQDPITYIPYKDQEVQDSYCYYCYTKTLKPL